MQPEKLDQQAGPNWKTFYERQDGREPRPLFVEALARFDAKPNPASRLHAIDLGCGDGAETLALLKAGWQVLAIDREPTAMTYVQAKVGPELQPQLQVMVAAFEALELPETDLVYAGFSLPFCRPDYFDRLWAHITARIRLGGRFAGQLFGVRDTWANNPEMTFHAEAQVSRLLAHGFETETLREIDEDGQALSGPKHWHVFDIIARKVTA